MVRAVLDVVYGIQEDQHGLGWVAGKRNLIFHANDGKISGRYHKWVQDELSVTMEIFADWD